MSAALQPAADSPAEFTVGPVRRFAPRLRAVEAGSRRPRRAYGIIAVAGALTIAAMQMVLSIVTTQMSYELATLGQTQRELTWQRQILHDELAGLASPQYLAANATALGMVINESPSYLRLSDGALLGTGEVSFGDSTVDALGRASVPNDLIATTPLVTSPRTSLDVPAPTDSHAAQAPGTPVEPATPPPLTDGLPTPSTH